MAKKIFGVYLAKLDAPNSEAHARLELPASPWELHDAMDKVQLQENEELYLEIDDYYGFELDEDCFSETIEPPTVALTATELVNRFEGCKNNWRDEAYTPQMGGMKF